MTLNSQKDHSELKASMKSLTESLPEEALSKGGAYPLATTTITVTT